MNSQSSNERGTRNWRLPLFEITVVFFSMLGLTYITTSAELVGAGSIAIWGGIFVASVFMWRRGVRWSDYGLKFPKGRRAWASSLGFAVLAAISVVAMVSLVSFVLVKMGFDGADNSSDRYRFFLGKPYLFVSYLFGVIWVGAALGEELFMRGFILNRLADMFGHHKTGWAAAVLVQAVVFGMMHVSQGVPGIIATGMVGLVFGTYYVVSKKRLFPIILAHGLVNTIGMTAYYFSDGAIT
jgi:membrane protease YdiL (CAAX protease family)